MVQKVKIKVGHSGDNFCCCLDENINGVVVATAETLDKLKEDFKESLQLHVDSCIEDGDILPDYFTNGNYELIYELDSNAESHL